MDPSVTDFIAREARFGDRNYEPFGVVLSRGEGVFVWDTHGHRYLDCLSVVRAESGSLPSEDLGRDGGAGGPAIARLSPRPTGPLLPRDRDADRLPQAAADEQRRRSGRECDQVGAQMGYEARGCPTGRPRSSSAPIVFTAAPLESSTSAPTRRHVTISDRSRRAPNAATRVGKEAGSV